MEPVATVRRCVFVILRGVASHAWLSAALAARLLTAPEAQLRSQPRVCVQARCVCPWCTRVIGAAPRSLCFRWPRRSCAREAVPVLGRKMRRRPGGVRARMTQTARTDGSSDSARQNSAMTRIWVAAMPISSRGSRSCSSPQLPPRECPCARGARTRVSRRMRCAQCMRRRASYVIAACSVRDVQLWRAARKQQGSTETSLYRSLVHRCCSADRRCQAISRTQVLL